MLPHFQANGTLSHRHSHRLSQPDSENLKLQDEEGGWGRFRNFPCKSRKKHPCPRIHRDVAPRPLYLGAPPQPEPGEPDMSVPNQRQRVTGPAPAPRRGGTPIVSLTAYTTPMARLLDPHVDMLLVGDSLGMVLYGMDSTLPVTLDMMIAHGAAVVRGSRQACIVVDLPFGSYQESPEAAFRSAARVMAETG